MEQFVFPGLEQAQAATAKTHRAPKNPRPTASVPGGERLTLADVEREAEAVEGIPAARTAPGTRESASGSGTPSAASVKDPSLCAAIACEDPRERGTWCGLHARLLEESGVYVAPAPVDPKSFADSPEVTARITATLRAAGMRRNAKNDGWEHASYDGWEHSAREPGPTQWERRLAEGRGPLPWPGDQYPQTIPYESLKASHPSIYERYKRGPSDNHIPTPACLAREMDDEFRAMVAAALRRAGDEEGAIRVLGTGAHVQAAGEDFNEETEASGSTLAPTSLPLPESDPEAVAGFRRASALRLRLARARAILSGAQRGAEAARRAREASEARARAAGPDPRGNLVDPETGEVISGPDSREAQIASWTVFSRPRRTEEKEDRAATYWPRITAAYCVAETARIRRLLDEKGQGKRA